MKNYAGTDVIYKFKIDDKYVYAKLDKEENICILETNEDLDLEDIDTDEFTNTSKTIEKECYDVDELAIEIAKQIIDSSTDFTYDMYDDEELYENIRMSKDYEIITSDKMVTLNLYPIKSFAARTLLYCTFDMDKEEDRDSIAEIKDWIEFGDSDCLEEFMDSHTNEMEETLNLWGYDDEEILYYTKKDSDGNELEEGEFQLRESSVIDYNGGKLPYGMNKYPDYILLRVDDTIKSWATYKVPEDLDFEKLRFERALWFRTGNGDIDGDSVTKLGILHYAGKEYDTVDEGNNGTTDGNYFLLERDRKDMCFYHVVEKCGCESFWDCEEDEEDEE